MYLIPITTNTAVPKTFMIKAKESVTKYFFISWNPYKTAPKKDAKANMEIDIEVITKASKGIFKNDEIALENNNKTAVTVNILRETILRESLTSALAPSGFFLLIKWGMSLNMADGIPKVVNETTKITKFVEVAIIPQSMGSRFFQIISQNKKDKIADRTQSRKM